MPSLEAGIAVLASLDRVQPRDSERLRRQRGQGHLILHEQLPLRLALQVVVLAGSPHALSEDPPVVGDEVVDARHRHEQVAAYCADGVLDGPLLMARVRVAEGEREAVVGGEPLEDVGRPDLLADPPADARGVVEDQPGRDSAAELEHGPQALADAFGGLAPEALRSDTLEKGT